MLDCQPQDPSRPAAQQILQAQEAADGIAGPPEGSLDLLGR